LNPLVMFDGVVDIGRVSFSLRSSEVSRRRGRGSTRGRGVLKAAGESNEQPWKRSYRSPWGRLRKQRIRPSKPGHEVGVPCGLSMSIAAGIGKFVRGWRHADSERPAFDRHERIDSTTSPAQMPQCPASSSGTNLVAIAPAQAKQLPQTHVDLRHDRVDPAA